MSNNVEETVESEAVEASEPTGNSAGESAAASDEGATPENAVEIEARGDDDATLDEGDDDDDDDFDDFEEDGRADRALDFVVDVLTKMGMDCTVDLMENEPGDPPTDIRIEISGNDAGRLVGKQGQTLGALQFLTNRVINRPALVRRHIMIDADGYRARREGALTSMAKKLGQQALDEGKIITFEPMSAQDRRIVHLALAKFAGVVTKSEGKGSSRRVQIIPVSE